VLCNNNLVPRKYELRRRAERQDETRQRIVEAAVALHTTLGPARTTVSAIADRAGVQRHTVYRHFPDERTLYVACSGLFQDLYPLPDPAPWQSIADPERRLRRGLTELYAYYERHAADFAPLLRDAEVHPTTREMLNLRITPQIERIGRVLAEPFALPARRQARLMALLNLFLNVQTFQQLTGELSREEAVESALRTLRAQ
jgi:AcrR family transcriptional regulator